MWEIIATVRDNDGSIDAAADYLGVPAGLIDAAVIYYGEFPDDVDEQIEVNETEYERGRKAAAAGRQSLRG